MDGTAARSKIEETLERQLRFFAEDDPALAAGRALMAALEPALSLAMVDLAEQAAAEVGAQLPGQDVEVVMVSGEPHLRVTGVEEFHPPADEEFEARISLRLPPSLKERIEDSAGESGESVNSWLVKTVSTRVTRSGVGTRIKGRIDT